MNIAQKIIWSFVSIFYDVKRSLVFTSPQPDNPKEIEIYDFSLTYPKITNKPGRLPILQLLNSGEYFVNLRSEKYIFIKKDHCPPEIHRHFTNTLKMPDCYFDEYLDKMIRFNFPKS